MAVSCGQLAFRYAVAVAALLPADLVANTKSDAAALHVLVRVVERLRSDERKRRSEGEGDDGAPVTLGALLEAERQRTLKVCEVDGGRFVELRTGCGMDDLPDTPDDVRRMATIIMGVEVGWERVSFFFFFAYL